MSEEQNYKTNYIRYGVLIFLWLLLVGGLSYAYFSSIFNNNKKTSAKVVTGKLDIDFTTSKYINNESMWPINDEDIFTSGDESKFSVSWNDDNTVDNVYYNIFLDNINIHNKFKSSYIKWRLYDEENPTSSSISISNGSFENIGNNSSVQLNNESIRLPRGATHNYTLYLWISNKENENQDELIGGSISCQVRIDAVTQ